MVLKRITDKNFLPLEGQKKIPVYSTFFNEAYDAVVVINARDIHAMDVTHVVKHPLMAVAVYDFDEVGGATGQHSLNNAIGLLPDNAIIRNVMYDVQTAVVATGATASVVFQLPTDGDLLTLDPVLTAGFTGMGLGTPLMASAATWVKTTAARAVQVDITGAGTINAGKVYCFIEYVMSELDASDILT